KLAERISARTGIPIHPADVLLDAPPVKLEVDIDVDVLGREGAIHTLGDVSPVASALAKQQFDSQVKQVRVFVRDDLRLELQRLLKPSDWTSELLAAADLLEQDVV
ncbi:metal-dependent phosphohydrolase, partial [bacterium]|nr:metal-dependent phosphohydrolase [bacterium]